VKHFTIARVIQGVTLTDESKRPDIAVPEEASGRGPFLRGELRKEQFSFPDILAQFERITPHTRNTRIYLLLTAEQAKKLYVLPGPFIFEGSFCTRDGVIETRLAKDIWLKPITQITHEEAFYWTQTSGAVGSLEVKAKFIPGPELDSRRDSNSAWFVARPCFVLGILANQTKEEAEESTKFGFSWQDINFSLTDGAKASIHRYPYLPFYGVSRNVKSRGYSITVEGIKDPLAAKRDVDVLILLASFASRQRSVSPHWSYDTKEEFHQFWQFNYGKFPKRYEREEPVLPRDREECGTFLQTAFSRYFAASQHQPLLEAAIYALLNEATTLEVEIARLFSAIQGALYFATQFPLDPRKRPRIGNLYHEFLTEYPNVFTGLWPLIDRQAGSPLSDLRNAVVHGEAFTEQEWLALSYAGEHLRWHLERIILVALGWDIEKSAVSTRALGLFTAYQNWKQERDKLASRLSPP
jgi:hypothetical protein